MRQVMPVCPLCGGRLERVEQSPHSMLNKHQFDAVKAGDWYCRVCPSNDRGQKPLCYWWDSELPEPHDYQI